MTTHPFDYNIAFSRTLGWLTEFEQSILREKKVAIAGMGGVGGHHLLSHTRLGIEKFHIADFDTFELANFNRQVGATMSSIGKPKVEVMRQLALDINPEATIQCFNEGLHEDNLDAFFKDVDLFVDGLDFFALHLRAKVFEYCHKNKIPAITAAPLGLGVSMLIFMPDHMSFEQYFKLNDHSPNEMALRFLTGLTPAALHRKALVDPSRVQLDKKIGPSTPMGCELCAAMVTSQSLKLLLDRGPVLIAPKSFHLDAYTYKTKMIWRPFGAYNPLQILHRYLARRHIRKQGNV